MRRQLSRLAMLTLASAFTGMLCAQGAELIENGGLETTVSPPFWTQTETVTGMPGAPISLSEQISFANSPTDPAETGTGLWVRPYFGNVGAYLGQNEQINFTLSQTINAFAGRTYTFAGDALIGDGYSGAAEVLDPFAPSDPNHTGTVPSPTQTTMMIEFLDASQAIIGAPKVLDLRTDTPVFGAWHTHTLVSDPSPTGTTRARVTISALNMVDNDGDIEEGGVPRDQTLYFDNFTLRDNVAPNDRLLNTNGNLNTPGAPANWTLTESPGGTNTAAVIGFAHHPTDSAPNGQGLWLRAFEGGTTPIDAILSQTVPGVAGENYVFSAWSRWEGGYSGGVDTLDPASPSGTIPSPTETTMELAFLNAGGELIGTPVTLDLRTEQMNDNMWRQHVVSGESPDGTASVRVTAAATQMLANVDVGGTLGNQSAFFDELSLQGPGLGSAGDYDGDGDADGNDFLVIQRGLGTTTSAADIAAWRESVGGSVAATAAVPEPASLILATVLAGLVANCSRRR